MNKKQEITVCGFLHNDGKLFIAKRAATKTFLPGKFELIGGHVEFGETPEAALKREIQEEFHIDVSVGNPFYVFTYVRDEGKTHAVEVDYFVKLVSPEGSIQINPEDHSEYRWICENEVEKFLPKDDEETKAVKRGFEILRLIPEYIK